MISLTTFKNGISYRYDPMSPVHMSFSYEFPQKFTDEMMDRFKGIIKELRVCDIAYQKLGIVSKDKQRLLFKKDGKTYKETYVVYVYDVFPAKEAEVHAYALRNSVIKLKKYILKYSNTKRDHLLPLILNNYVTNQINKYFPT